MSEEKSLNFLEEIVETDLSTGKHKTIQTRFPPEPNGYLHIGHAKSICLNFGLADKYGGKTNLRFDDTNPVTEETEYVESIKEDVKWLGFDWEEEHYASDYFDQIYAFAIDLIKKGLAYVDEMSPEEIAATKGTPTEPGKESPARNKSIEENLAQFTAMREGKYNDGEKVLRAKVDMASPNMQLRDPIMYRIKKTSHHRTGDAWCIYPMYDFAHGQSDSIENITHSICTLEFEVHRPLYNWYIEKLGIFPSRQFEFARLNLTYTVMSKRKLLQLVQEKLVDGWDDPRMPTISGLRRRGFTPLSLRNFCDKIGVQRRENIIDVGLLEFCIREDLNKISTRRMVVLDPIKLIITNYPAGQTEILKGENNPEEENNGGYRDIPFTRELWIESEDFQEVPQKKWFRLAPDMKVRLKNAYIIHCTGFNKNEEGKVTEVLCEYIPESKSGQDTSGINVKGTMHWVSAEHALDAEVRLYDRLFNAENPLDEEGDFKSNLNPTSLEIIPQAKIEPALKDAKLGEHFQFIRKGYFCLDAKLSSSEKLVFNRTVTLKDTWAKEAVKQ
jgi:glutaminyl-tRNA synthetase